MRSPTRAHRPALLLVIASIAVVLVSPLRSQSPPAPGRTVFINGREAVAGEVLVRMRPSAQAVQQRARVAAAADAPAAETLGRSGLHRMRSRRFSTAQLVSQMSQDPEVEYAEPNWVLRASVLPNDPTFTHLWGLFNTGSNTWGGAGTAGVDIDAPSAWNVTTGTRSVVVGVIDTGVDYNHQDLAPNMWSAPTSFTVNIAGQAITCAAGTHGFNAITRTCDPMDDATNPHGSHVAGTIGAAGNNGVIMLDNERDHEERMKRESRSPGIRHGIGLTGPITETRVRDRAAMMMAGRHRVGMLEGAGHGKGSQNQIDPRKSGRESDGRYLETTHGISPCNACTAFGASHSRGPTARPNNVPCRSMNTVVGKARTR